MEFLVIYLSSPSFPSLPFSPSFGRSLARNVEGRGGEKMRSGREVAGGEEFLSFGYIFGRSGRKFWFCGFSFSRVDVGEEGSERKKFFSPLLEILEM